MDIIYINRDYIVNILSKDEFFILLPEFNFMQKYKNQMQMVIDNKMSCSSCTEKNTVQPAILNFVSYLILKYKENNTEFFDRLKLFTVHHLYKKDCELRFAFQENDNSEIMEITI